MVAAIVLLAAIAVAAEGGDDAGAVLMHHVSDGHEWQPLPFLPAIPLRDITVGPLTIPVTRHVVMLWVVALILAPLLIIAFGRKSARPSPLASVFEPILMFVRDGLVLPTMGRELGERWLPFFYTLFLFILTANLLGLVPLFPTVTGNLAVTGGLALMVLVAIIGQGMVHNGVGGFFTNMVPDGVPSLVAPFLIFIEVMGVFIRSSVLAIRLFANMVAGHFVIFSLLMLMMLVHPAVGFASVPMALFIDLLEVLVAIIQAVVFTMLSAVFIGMACASH